MSYFASSILIAVLAASTAAAAEPSAATATLLDGSEVVGTVTEWTADRLTLESPDGPRVLNREELLDVSWDDEVSASGQHADPDFDVRRRGAHCHSPDAALSKAISRVRRPGGAR
jgi:hypothetical protein